MILLAAVACADIPCSPRPFRFSSFESPFRGSGIWLAGSLALNPKYWCMHRSMSSVAMAMAAAAVAGKAMGAVPVASVSAGVAAVAVALRSDGGSWVAVTAGYSLPSSLQLGIPKL